jgi:hypothetical protein
VLGARKGRCIADLCSTAFDLRSLSLFPASSASTYQCQNVKINTMRFRKENPISIVIR